MSIEDTLSDLIRANFKLTPKGIIDSLKLRRPIYAKTAAYGHFGRNDPDFTWEATDKAAALASNAGCAGDGGGRASKCFVTAKDTKVHYGIRLCEPWNSCPSWLKIFLHSNYSTKEKYVDCTRANELRYQEISNWPIWARSALIGPTSR